LLGLQQHRYLLPELHKNLRTVIPLIAEAGIKHVHLYGVLWEPAIAPFAWMCHCYGLSCSTDSKQPITACRSTCTMQRQKAGGRHSYWRDNAAWWQDFMLNISHSKHYKFPELGLS